jgi:hypothetical protein
MSDEQKQPEQQQPAQPTIPTHECESCGKNGFRGEFCNRCGRPINQPRQFTLSEVRAGLAPVSDRPSGAAPRIVDVPGSGGPGGK